MPCPSQQKLRTQCHPIITLASLVVALILVGMAGAKDVLDPRFVDAALKKLGPYQAK